MSPATRSEYRYMCTRCKSVYNHPWHHYCDMCECQMFVRLEREDDQLIFDFMSEIGFALSPEGSNG